MPKSISDIFQDFRYFLLLSLIYLSAVIANAQDTLVLEQLDYKFVTYDDGVLSSITALENADVASIFVPCTDSYTLAFCGTNPFSIWVDGRHVTTKIDQKCLYKEVSFLCSFVSRDTIFVSVSSDYNLNDVSIQAIEIGTQKKKEEYRPEWKKKRKLDLIVLILCGAAIVGLSFLAPLNAGELFSVNFESFSGRPGSIGNFIQISVATLISGLLWSSLRGANVSETIYAIGAIATFWVVKNGIYIVSGRLFGFKKLAQWQQVFQVKYWSYVSILFFIVVVLEAFFIGTFEVSNRFLNQLFIIAIGIQILLEFFISSSYRRAKSLHRFIYLCNTEILPAILVIQFFLK